MKKKKKWKHLDSIKDEQMQSESIIVICLQHQLDLYMCTYKWILYPKWFPPLWGKIKLFLLEFWPVLEAEKPNSVVILTTVLELLNWLNKQKSFKTQVVWVERIFQDILCLKREKKDRLTHGKFICESNVINSKLLPKTRI